LNLKKCNLNNKKAYMDKTESKISAKISEQTHLSPEIIEEFKIIIGAWESIGMTEKEIREELKDYDLYL